MGYFTRLGTNSWITLRVLFVEVRFCLQACLHFLAFRGDVSRQCTLAALWFSPLSGCHALLDGRQTQHGVESSRLLPWLVREGSAGSTFGSAETAGVEECQFPLHPSGFPFSLRLLASMRLRGDRWVVVIVRIGCSCLLGVGCPCVAAPSSWLQAGLSPGSRGAHPALPPPPLPPPQTLFDRIAAVQNQSWC